MHPHGGLTVSTQGPYSDLGARNTLLHYDKLTARKHRILTARSVVKSMNSQSKNARISVPYGAVIPQHSLLYALLAHVDLQRCI
ncbi:hypothetical protein DPMN_021244 [Dreissena polymorpha]|uniref:Uncharacterized protein n=1 Tax=Dreissena polymorpha TaxID=45954 RepID=A0A9D4SAX8_DREPO|nr:hypothetical protein DPMN_021244 [Dreissena polymorpha]